MALGFCLNSLCRSTVNSCTIPPKTSGNSSAFDNRQITGEMSTAANSGDVSKVSRPPPRVPNGIEDSYLRLSSL